MPVVERRGPVVGFVVLDCDTRAGALAKLIVIVGRSKIVAADYIVNVLGETVRSGVGRRRNKVGLTDATPPGEIRGSIRAVSKLAESIRQLAWTLFVYETKRSVIVERSVGDMIIYTAARDIVR